jgi:hypothetical protein
MKTTNKQFVEEVPWGMYVWELPSKEILGDGEGNVMNVFVWERKDRPAAKAALEAAAKAYGHPEGKAVWWSGVRQINDEELQEQVERAKQGLVPDILDIPAIKGDLR